MTLTAAFMGAVGNFVSAWIFCLMQVIPFFVAYIVGSGLRAKGQSSSVALKTALFSFAGFAFVFVCMGMSGAAVSKFIFSHIVFLTQIGGVVIGLSGLVVAGWLTLDETKRPVHHTVVYLLPLLFGAAVGFAYKPCVSPALTIIYRIAGTPATVGEGGLLLLAYAMGIAVVIGVVSFLVTMVIANYFNDVVQALIKMACALVVITLAVVVLTGNMTPYKSFLVGRFAPTIEVAP